MCFVCVSSQSPAVNSLGGKIRSWFVLCILQVVNQNPVTVVSTKLVNQVLSDCHACIKNITIWLNKCASANVCAGSYYKRSTTLKLTSAFVMPIFVCALLVSVMFLITCLCNVSYSQYNKMKHCFLDKLAISENKQQMPNSWQSISAEKHALGFTKSIYKPKTPIPFCITQGM